jgi:hypothetical protein
MKDRTKRKEPRRRSITRWCEDGDISRSSYYNLVKNGIGPESIKVLGKVNILERYDVWLLRMKAQQAGK